MAIIDFERIQWLQVFQKNIEREIKILTVCPFTGILFESRLFFPNGHPKIRHRFSLAFYIMPNPKNQQQRSNQIKGWKNKS